MPIAPTAGCISLAWVPFLILIVILIVIRMNRLFDHEKLQVYQQSVAFVAWLEPLLQKIPKRIASHLCLTPPGACLLIIGPFGPMSPFSLFYLPSRQKASAKLRCAPTHP